MIIKIEISKYFAGIFLSIFLLAAQPQAMAKNSGYFKPASSQSDSGGYIHSRSQNNSGSWWEALKEKVKNLGR